MTEAARVLRQNHDRQKEYFEQARVLRAREGLLNFTKFLKSDYQVNWHHRILCQKLNQFARGELKRLMVFMPPRHGKSELVSRKLPAFIFGIKPTATIIATSYGADLAARMNRDVQRLIDSPEYRQVFPGTVLSGDNVRTNAQTKWLRNSDIFEVVDWGGVYRCAGVGGGITGMGGEFLIIDDPIKNQKEADSPVYRDMVWEWYASTLYTRLERDGSILLTMTRWHEDDLAGRLLQLQKSEPEADQWEVLSFPALKEHDRDPLDPREVGEALWPWKYNAERLKGLKPSVGSRVWTSLYQQNPTAVEGTIIKHSYLVRRWKALPAKFDVVIQSWDLSFKDSKGSDFVVGQVWGKLGAEFYLIDQLRARIPFTATIQAIKDMTAKHPKALLKLVEDKANGPAVISALHKEIPGLVAIEPEGSKESRLNAVSPLFEAGNVILPDASMASWVKDYVDELCGFPRAAKDDQVDATTQALLRLWDGAGEFTEDFIPPENSTKAYFPRNEDSW